MALPLTHRINHIPVYVPAEDDAWDIERIEREKGWIDGTVEVPEGQVVPWQELDDHPIVRYHSGMSRFDMTTVSEYLDTEKKPLRFVLKRMSLREWEEAQATAERSSGGVYGVSETRRLSLRYGLTGVENLPEWAEKPGSLGYSESQLESLRDLIGDHQYIMLGFACLTASRPLDPLEEKS